MVDYDSLRASERRDYDEAVRGTHYRRVEAVILNKSDGKPIGHGALTNKFLGGGIHGDDSRTPVEVLDAVILDDDYALDWHHGEHRKFLIQITDARFVPALDEWVEKVVFTGPLWTFERTGPEVQLKAQGMERTAMGSVRRVRFWPRKSRADRVGGELLSEAGTPANGMKIPKMKARLPESVTIGVPYGKKVDGKDKDKRPDHRRKKQKLKVTRADTYWGKAMRIFQALDRDLFSNGRGKFIVDSPQSKPFASLTDQQILSPVTVKPGDDGDATNTWYILGHDPKGPKERVHAKVALPDKHPLSAESQNRNGAPYEVSETVENRHLRRRAQAVRLGKRLRDKAMREQVSYQVEALPVIPWIRPAAMISIPTPGGRSSMRVRQWTLPLGPGADPLTLGANRRSSWR